ncbi:MAG: translocation/assembly module TamB domain-containing protein [Bacteroidales bacterium]
MRLQQEVEFALSTQLLNDRVVINGNFDVGGQENSSTTNNISGDFDVEVKLTEKVRFKVFNRSNDNILYETAPYTQGFGLFFRRDFNRFGDIFRSNRGDMKKEDEPGVKQWP